MDDFDRSGQEKKENKEGLTGLSLLSARLRAGVARLRDPRTRRYLLIAISVFFVAAVVLLVNVQISSEPRYCGLCHEIGPQVRAWEKSAHSEVGCYGCHILPGRTSFVELRLQLASDIYKHLTQFYEYPVNKGGEVAMDIPSENCTRCHVPKRRVTPRRGIVLNHEVHPKKGIPCTTCHNRVGHPGVGRYSDNMRMEACFRCHGLGPTAEAPGRCDACHTEQFDLTPGTHKAAAWRHGGHGKKALVDDRTCRMCHLPSFCRDCHGLTMPHPDGWAKGESLHVSAGSRNSTVCAKCHPGRDVCASCHHRDYMPLAGPWKDNHMKVVRRQGAFGCVQCHRLTDCAYCHSHGVKPPGMTARS